MPRPRKYPKTTGYYVYVHITPDKMCYFGMSKQQPSNRWRIKYYKATSLEPYIDQCGWDNIEHMVIQDSLTHHQAEVIEQWFIDKAKSDGFCINRLRSGGITRDKKKYNRQYYKIHCEEIKEHQRIYSQTLNKEHIREYKREWQRNRYQNDPEYRKHQCECQRQWRLKKKALKN